jgi:hypothetical protein
MAEIDQAVLPFLQSYTFWIVWCLIGLPIAILHLEWANPENTFGPETFIIGLVVLTVLWPTVVIYHILITIRDVP